MGTRSLCTFLTLIFLCAAETHASTILIYLSAGRIFVVSDSLANRIEGGPGRPVCKIVQVRSDMVFAATGSGVFQDPPFDPYEMARDIARTKATPSEAAREYGKRALAPLQKIWSASREHYLRVRRDGGASERRGPQDYVFLGFDAEKNLSAAGASFLESDPISRTLVVASHVELHARDANDVFLGRYGVFENMPDDAEFNRRAKQTGIESTLMHFVEIQILATPRLVGPPIVLLELNRDGSFNWRNRGPCVKSAPRSKKRRASGELSIELRTFLGYASNLGCLTSLRLLRNIMIGLPH